MKMPCAKCGANVRFYACPGACTAAVEALIAETPIVIKLPDA